MTVTAESPSTRDMVLRVQMQVEAIEDEISQTGHRLDAERAQLREERAEEAKERREMRDKMIEMRTTFRIGVGILGITGAGIIAAVAGGMWKLAEIATAILRLIEQARPH